MLAEVVSHDALALHLYDTLALLPLGDTLALLLLHQTLTLLLLFDTLTLLLLCDTLLLFLLCDTLTLLLLCDMLALLLLCDTFALALALERAFLTVLSPYAGRCLSFSQPAECLLIKQSASACSWLAFVCPDRATDIAELGSTSTSCVKRLSVFGALKLQILPRHSVRLTHVVATFHELHDRVASVTLLPPFPVCHLQ